MDPITTAIIAALAKLSETAVRDAYQALKTLIAKKFGPNSDLAEAVTRLEQKPDSAGRLQTLGEEITAAKANQDDELRQAAEALLEQLKTLPGGEQRIQQIVTGIQNVVSGTGNVTVTFRPTKE
jgi:phage terminase small subunit